MLPILTKIKAVREDPKDPIKDCYPTTPEALVALSLTRVIANHQPTSLKEESTPMISINPANPNYLTDDDVIKASKKRYVSGVGANDNPIALVGALHRLGLCSSEMAEPLKKLAAQKRPLNEFLQVSLHDVDRALAGVECTPLERMGFKNSLNRAGLLK
jgi:hypothetical protein